MQLSSDWALIKIALCNDGACSRLPEQALIPIGMLMQAVHALMTLCCLEVRSFAHQKGGLAPASHGPLAGSVCSIALGCVQPSL